MDVESDESMLLLIPIDEYVVSGFTCTTPSEVSDLKICGVTS